MITLPEIQKRIDERCLLSARESSEVTLVAVSKTKPPEAIEKLYNEGQRHFGENKLQELMEKAPVLPDDICWHYIGQIQRNKIRKILQYSTFIHSVGSLKVLETINRIAGEEKVSPNLFFQVNIDREGSKGGFLEEELAEILDIAVDLPHVRVAGLMCIPAVQENPEDTRLAFRKVSSIQDQIQKDFSLYLPYLSMGMSGDYEEAIVEGATHIRVGSALFGERNYA